MDPPSPAPQLGSACPATGLGHGKGCRQDLHKDPLRTSSTAHAPTGTAGSGPCTDLGFRVLPLIPVLFDTLRAGAHLKHNTHSISDMLQNVEKSLISLACSSG